MKDHEFRESVNELRDLVKQFAHTQQLRARMAEFLSKFKEKCNVQNQD